MKQLILLFTAVAALSAFAEIRITPDRIDVGLPPITADSDFTISEDSEYTANTIILGENVTLGNGVKLTLNYTKSLKVRNNVNCKERSKLVVNYKK